MSNEFLCKSILRFSRYILLDTVNLAQSRFSHTRTSSLSSSFLISQFVTTQINCIDGDHYNYNQDFDTELANIKITLTIYTSICSLNLLVSNPKIQTQSLWNLPHIRECLVLKIENESNFIWLTLCVYIPVLTKKCYFSVLERKKKIVSLARRKYSPISLSFY